MRKIHNIFICTDIVVFFLLFFFKFRCQVITLGWINKSVSRHVSLSFI